MKTKFISIAAISVVAIAAAACSGATEAGDLNNTNGGSSSTGGSVSTQGGSGLAPGAGGSTGGSPPTSTGGSASSTFGGSPTSTGGSPPTGSGGSPPAGTGGSGAVTSGGSISNGGSIEPVGGGGSGGMPATGGASGGGMPNGGSGGEVTGPYAPRTGSFKMLIYSQVIGGAFRHPSIQAGQRMLQDIAKKQGFEATIAQNESEINPTGLAKYELVFFLNSTGEIFNTGDQRKDYEAWIRNNGAFAGMHGATDSAQSWQFYKELTGQYYDLHDQCCATAQIQWTAAGQDHFVGKGLPNPWSRSEEWYKFNRHGDWSTKTGFTILNTVTTAGGGTRPVSFVREWSNFRAFYTSLGHEDGPYSDPDVIKHVTQGIMWAVRREALIVR